MSRLSKVCRFLLDGLKDLLAVGSVKGVVIEEIVGLFPVNRLLAAFFGFWVVLLDLKVEPSHRIVTF